MPGVAFANGVRDARTRYDLTIWEELGSGAGRASRGQAHVRSGLRRPFGTADRTCSIRKGNGFTIAAGMIVETKNATE